MSIYQIRNSFPLQFSLCYNEVIYSILKTEYQIAYGISKISLLLIIEQRLKLLNYTAPLIDGMEVNLLS